jgi:P27 family predicted phage terminase small subunit
MVARKTVEQRRRTGRSPKRDAGGRLLPEPVVVLSRTAETPQPPAGLKAAGRAAWEWMWDEGGWLCGIDTPMLILYCRNEDRLARWEAQVGQDGDTVDGARGQLRPHPLLARIEAVTVEQRHLLDACGFGPAARARLGYAEVKRQGALDELMRRRRA